MYNPFSTSFRRPRARISRAQSFNGDSFEHQIIVSGYYEGESTEEWREKLRRKLSFVLKNRQKVTGPKGLGVWTFWEVNDGFGERYRAYINGELVNPFE